MFNMRYHIASLVAVFLALAVGLLLGTVIEEKGLIENRQQALVERLQRDYERLRVESADSRKAVLQAATFADELLPLVMRDRLQGRNVAIVAVGDLHEEVRKSAVDCLLEGGGSVSSSTVFFPGSVDVTKGFSALKRVQTAASGPDESRYREIITLTAMRQIVEPVRPVVLFRMRDAGLLKASGTYGSRADAILFFTDVTVRSNDTGAATVIKTLKSLGLPVIGVETSDEKTGTIKLCAGNGFSSVDDIDLPAGKIALSYCINGSKGRFGIKDSADRLLPAAAP